jgi:hypothetical protein
MNRAASNASARAAAWAATVVATAALGAAALVPTAAQAKTVPISESVRLTLVKKTGTSFVHRGTAKGTYDGSVSARMKLSSLSISGTVTIRTKGGSVRLRISGRARSSGLNSKFDGKATIAGGTGKFAKARGTGKYTGVVNRRNWAATIDAKGSMTL